MTQEEKDLLFIDICGRLPYNQKVVVEELKHEVCTLIGVEEETITVKYNTGSVFSVPNNIECRPYLRPIDSMTDSEGKEFIEMMCDNRYCQLTDWFNSHHFDYRGLIENGLALEAPEDMYK